MYSCDILDVFLLVMCYGCDPMGFITIKHETKNVGENMFDFCSNHLNQLIKSKFEGNGDQHFEKSPCRCVCLMLLFVVHTISWNRGV